MKRLPVFITLLIGLLVIVGCSSNSNTNETQDNLIAASDPYNGAYGQPMSQEEARQYLSDRIDDLGIYDVIVTDVDGWDICMWQVRNRSNRAVVTYRGDLIYTSGSHTYIGSGSAAWDYENNIFSTSCLDSSWSGGHIQYTMTFQGYDGDGNVYLRGPYWYFENPNRVNRIDAWVFEGAFYYINPGSAESTPPRSKEEILDYLTSGTDKPKALGVSDD